MTREAVAVIREKLKDNADLRRAFLASSGGAALIKIGSDAGFILDDSDAEALIAIQKEISGQLGDDALDKLAGGDDDSGAAGGGGGAPPPGGGW